MYHIFKSIKQIKYFIEINNFVLHFKIFLFIKLTMHVFNVLKLNKYLPI